MSLQQRVKTRLARYKQELASLSLHDYIEYWEDRAREHFEEDERELKIKINLLTWLLTE